MNTSQYKAVQGSSESPVPLNKEVHRSHCTSKYKALYLLVPTYSGVQDFWVLPCTALYCDVSTNGKSRNCCVGNKSIYWFILVHTSTYCCILTGECVYLYIPVFIVTYKYISVHTSSYQHIPACTHTYWSMLVHTGPYMYIPGYQYIPDDWCVNWRIYFWSFHAPHPSKNTKNEYIYKFIRKKYIF